MENNRVLVIDDEKAICEGCRMILSEAGYLVDIRSTGRSGMETVLGDIYDVTLLDIKLPDMDGMDILRAVRKEKPNEYFIVMTGYSTVQNAVEAMKLGAFDYLVKPFSDDELKISVERALEKRALVQENLALRKELRERFDFKNIIGKNPNILRIFDEIRRVAPTDSTILLNGESGTGKEIFARTIHAHSQRSAKQFVAVDCSTLSPGLLESELFGHVKGAFTDAVRNEAGIFEVANGGTLFLDDIANLSLETQGKLLRVLEAQEYKPVGSSSFKKTDIRIIAATNQDLKTMITDGRFREDLFYRLNVVPVFLPPLRERKEDIPELAYHFLRLYCKRTGKCLDGFTDDALEMLVNHEWPGNVRELKNVVERLIIMEDKNFLDIVSMIDHLRLEQPWGKESIPKTLKELRAVKRHLLEHRYGEIEKAFLVNALNTCDWNVTRAAERVGMQRPNFHLLMRKHTLSKKDYFSP